MPILTEDITKRGLDPGTVSNKDLTSSTSLGEFKGQTPTGESPDISGLTANLTRSLSSALTSMPNQAEGEKSILQKFAERRSLAEKGATATGELIKSEAGTALEEAQKLGQRELTSEVEARRGFATNTAMVKQLTETGEKRIRDLSKVRDELLLKNDIAKADQMDKLLSEEQTTITTARSTWLTNFLNLTKGLTDVAGFETPAQKQTRELGASQQSAVMNLAATAPSAGILTTDNYNSAIQKYRNSSEYRQSVRKGEAEISKIEAEKAKLIPESTPGMNLKNLTVDQAKARQFGVAAGNANDILNSSVYTPGYVENPWMPNVFKGEERQGFEQAARAFVNATLRRESGATITDSEFLNKYEELIPRAGDRAPVLEQKVAARTAAVASIREAGLLPPQPVGEKNLSSTPPETSTTGYRSLGTTPQDLSGNFFNQAFNSLGQKK